MTPEERIRMLEATVLSLQLYIAYPEAFANEPAPARGRFTMEQIADKIAELREQERRSEES